MKSDYGIDLIIPYGTAVQNLRMTSINAADPVDSTKKNDFSYDGTHLTSGIGDYVAACAYFEALFAPRYDVTVLGNRYTNISIPVPQPGDSDYYQGRGVPVQISSSNARLAQRAAILAVNDMFHLNNPKVSGFIPTNTNTKYTYTGSGDLSGLIDGIYDVTANNNNAKFASLYDLLSDEHLSDLIPNTVRKGGMSIKFVLSSDNKYVQYRYMGTAIEGSPNPFLDTANWQGVDDGIHAESEELAKSGDVYAETHLCNIPEVNGLLVDIVLKEGVEIDFTHFNRIRIVDVYGNNYAVGISLSDSTGTYPSIWLYSKSYASESAALAAFGTLLESDYCYIVLRHAGFTGGKKDLTNVTLAFNKDISYKSLSEHPVIKELLIERETGEEINDLSFSVAEISYTSVIANSVIRQGEIRSNDDYSIYPFPVTGGSIVCVELNKSVNVNQEIAFMDANDNMIAVNTLDSSIDAGTATRAYVLVPDNATKMLVLKFRSRPVPVVHTTNLDLTNFKQFFKKATPTETIDGYYVNLNGNLSSLSDRATETYTVKAGDTYFVDVKSCGHGGLVLSFYNSETPSATTLIQDVSLVGDENRKVIQAIVPTGAVRMRISFMTGTLNYHSVYYAEGVDLSDYPVISELLSRIAELETIVGAIVGDAAIEYSELDLVQGFYSTKNLAVGGIINENVVGKSDPNMKCGKFAVKEGDIIKICTSTNPSTGARPYVLTDNSGVVKQLSSLGGDCTTPVTITAAEDGFLYICEKLSSMTGYTFSVEIYRTPNDILDNIQKQIDEVNAKISLADELISYDDSGFKNGYYYAPGTLSVGDTYVEDIKGRSDEDLLCNRFSVKSGDVVTLCTSMGTGSPSSKARPYFLTDKNKVITVLTPTGSNTLPSATFTIEDDGYLYVCEKLSKMGDYTFSMEIKRTFDYSSLPDMRDDIDKLKADIIVDDNIPLSVVKETPGMTAILHRIGVVGASLTNGGHNTTNGSFGQAAGREYSWPQRLARLCGITCFNFGQGGYWCKKWLDNDGGYYEAVGEPENKCDAYIISFASNDIYSKSGYYVGTIADVHVGNESENGASYYGYLSQVIARCHDVQKRAYLFVLTYPHGFGETESGGYTQAMRDIVEVYREAGYNIYLIDYAAYGMTVDEATERGFKRNAHYVGAGYQYMTYEICTYIDWIIRHNIEDFKDIAFVRTTAEYVEEGETPVGYDSDDYFIGPNHEYLGIDIRRPRGVITQTEFDEIFNDW